MALAARDTFQLVGEVEQLSESFFDDRFSNILSIIQNVLDDLTTPLDVCIFCERIIIDVGHDDAALLFGIPGYVEHGSSLCKRAGKGDRIGVRMGPRGRSL